MNDIRFDTQENEFGTPTQQKQGFDLSGTLISWGVVADKKQADYLMLGTVIVALILSVFAYRALSGGPEVPLTPVYSAAR